MRRGKAAQGSLANIVEVPLDVFAEIASYLHPLDILSLARSTKYFRKLIMQPSAKHIWHAAGRNVPGLPECPPHLSEPAYAALIFQKTCSICGTTVPRNPDPWLYVRLCPDCIHKNVVGHWLIPDVVQPYVPSSTYLIKRPSGAYSLRTDVNFVTNKLIELAGSGDSVVAERWRAQRREDIESRKTYSTKFGTFLLETLMRRGHEQDELIQQRVDAIHARLIEHGWGAVDFNITYLPLMRSWEKLVEVAKPLTDRTWTNLYPKLKPILEANRRHREEQERQQRLATRLTLVNQFLENARGDQRPYIQLATDSETASASVVGEKLNLPAPDIKSMKELQFISEMLYESRDLTAEETSAKLESLRPKFDHAVLWWRRDLEEELVGIASDDDPFSLLMPGRHRLRDKTRPNRWINDKRTIVPTSATFTAESNEHVHDDTRRLLRADTVFGISGSPSLCFYPEVVYELERKLDSDSNISRYVKRSRVYQDDYESDELKRLNTSLLRFDQPVHEIAEELLRRLGRPDAAYLEMKALGRRFVCERCWNKRPMEWAEMLNHYDLEYRLHGTRSDFYKRRQLDITYYNLHDLGDGYEEDDGVVRPEVDLAAKNIIERLSVRVLTEDEAVSVVWPPPSPLVGCRLCKMVPPGFGEVNCLPKGSRETIEEHLREAHAVTTADLLEEACFEIEESN
ncbi:hypothetical protein BDV93DRAFT_603553 [Ceratobasidium sp. AG-I]|nr:hypothetical protein BDV93DRAFT_603553 [Ceratobasidium sp. AG-I]